jgi:hypothetical protein
LPFDKLKAPSIAEGLRVDPEQRFTHRPKGRTLAPPNGSKRSNIQFRKERIQRWNGEKDRFNRPRHGRKEEGDPDVE